MHTEGCAVLACVVHCQKLGGRGADAREASLSGQGKTAGLEALTENDPRARASEESGQSLSTERTLGDWTRNPWPTN